MRFTRLFGAVLALPGLASIGVLAGAGVAQSATSNATLTIVQGLPNTSVDVYINGKPTWSGLTFGQTKPSSMAPGAYTIAIRKSGTAQSSKPLLSAPTTLASGGNASVVIAMTASGSSQLVTFKNPTSSVARRDTRLIVRHLAQAGGLDVYAGQTKIVTNMINGQQRTATLASGRVSLKADNTGTTTTVLGPTTVRLSSRATTIVYYVGSGPGKSLRSIAQGY